MTPTQTDPVLRELARVLREGRARMPAATFEQACEQIQRSLGGHTVAPASVGALGPLAGVRRS